MSRRGISHCRVEVFTGLFLHAKIKSNDLRKSFPARKDLKLSNVVSLVEIGQETMKLGRKVWKKGFESLRAEHIAVCMQRSSFRRGSLSWETSFDRFEKKRSAFPGVSSHPAVRPGLGFKSKRLHPIFNDFSCGPYLKLRIAMPRETLCFSRTMYSCEHKQMK